MKNQAETLLPQSLELKVAIPDPVSTPPRPGRLSGSTVFSAVGRGVLGKGGNFLSMSRIWDLASLPLSWLGLWLRRRRRERRGHATHPPHPPPFAAPPRAATAAGNLDSGTKEEPAWTRKVRTHRTRKTPRRPGKERKRSMRVCSGMGVCNRVAGTNPVAPGGARSGGAHHVEPVPMHAFSFACFLTVPFA